MIPAHSSREERILRRNRCKGPLSPPVQVEETEVSIRRRLTAGIGLKNETFQLGGTYMKVVDIVAEHRWKFAMELFAAEIMMEMKNGMISIETIKRIVDEHRALWAPPRNPGHPCTTWPYR